MQGCVLPVEIVASILSLLPVKSLMRFRCVCKEWCSLTYNPDFIKEHHTCARALGRLALISTRYSALKILLYDFGDNGEVRNQAFNMTFGDMDGYTVSNPVNGLICIGCRGSNRCDDVNHYLLNPATRELAKLPTSGNVRWDKRTGLGLGFDSSTGGHKMVKPFHIGGLLDSWGCEVLELGTQEWREVGGAPCRIPMTEPVLVNGDLNWLSWRHCPTGNKFVAEMIIVAFNLKNEDFRVIPVPPECRIQVNEVYLVEWEGLLCLVKLPDIFLSERDWGLVERLYLVRIWKLEEYATCRWSEAHRSHMSNYAPIHGRLFHVVGIIGHEMLLVLSQGGGIGLICSYDLCTRKLRELYREHPSGLQFLTESLVSPRYLAGNPSIH